MSWQISFPVILLFVGTAISLTIMQVAWSRRRMPGAAPFALMMLAAAFWSFGSALEHAAPNFASKLFWSKFQYPGIATLPIFWFIFALEYNQQKQLDRWFRGVRAAIWLIPLTTIFMVLTNEQHGLIWSRVTITMQSGQPSLVYEHGTWFWIHAAFTYTLLLAGTMRLVWTGSRSPHTMRSSVGAIIAGALIPWIANIMYLSKVSPFFLDDPTPLAFIATGLIYTFGVFRFHLLDLMPVALDMVVESMPNGVLVLDDRERVVYLNPSAQSLLGVDYAIGKNVAEVFKDRITKIDFSLASKTDTLEISNADGQIQSIDIIASPRYNRFHHLAGQVVILRDTTERKRTEERLRLQSIALNAAANGIVISDEQGTIIWVNPAFSRITGYEPGEAIGQKTSLLKSGKHDAAFYQNLWNTIHTGRVWHGEMTNRRKDGTLYVEEQTIAPVRDEQQRITHFISIKQDISQRAEVEALRDELTHTLVHDLRNPLNSILVSLDMFRLVHVDLPDILSEALQISRENAWRLLSMVNSILDINQLESGQMPIRRDTIDLVALVEQACQLQSSMAKRNEILLLNDIPYNLPEIQADAKLISRVLQNLLDNAIKFSPQGGNIILSAYENASKKAVIVSIKDQGPGISTEMQPRLFQKFSVGDTTRSGTGLGLVFCRLAIEAHGGDIWVESNQELGTAFIFSLPI